MPGTALPILTSWQSFFTVMGAAAATLTGLMFIAVTLIAGIEVHVPTMNAALSAFSTPTVVHFCSVLLLAVLLSAPWQAFTGVSLALGLLGLVGVVYLITVIRSMGRIPDYRTPLRDWVWYGTVPLCANVGLMVAAAILPGNPRLGLSLTGGVMIALLLTGIRNAWDLVTFLAVERAHGNRKDDE